MLLRMVDWLRYRGNEADTDGLDARRLESLLAPALSPSRGFVAGLEEKIRAESIPTMRTVSPWRGRLVQIAALVVVGVIATVSVWAATRPAEPKQVSAAVIATAFANLESVDTLRYEVDARVNPGSCGTGFNVPATEEERARLGVERVILVTCGPDHYLERGEYDPDTGPHGLEEYAVVSEKLDGSLFVGSTSEIRRISGTIYIKDWRDDGWRTGTLPGGWNPTGWNPIAMMQGGSFVGLGGLRHVIRDHADALDHGEEYLDGERVRHYSASKPIPGSNYSEEVEVWVGVEDGLPRRAILKTYLEGSNWFESLKARAEESSNDPESDYYGDPVVTRGPEPDSTSWAVLDYRFFDFDAPLDIRAPQIE